MRVEVTLQAQSEKQAPVEARRLHPGLLYHQWRTAQALQRAPLVMNTYNTGTGKTRASLLHLHELPRDGESHVLFIAPTNELLHQHAGDIQAFVQDQKLPFLVVELNAAKLHDLTSPGVQERRGEKLVRLIRNPYEFADQLGLDPASPRTHSLILVTNPDLFYYAFYWQFGANDQRNLFQAFVTAFRYVVIDEFHYYNSKQLANFLLFVILSHEFGYFDNNERRICLLSATPSSEVKLYLDRIFGADKWALISPDNEPPEEAQPLELEAVLAPLRLVIESGTVEEYAAVQGVTVRQWLVGGLDGALISGALWRINTAYAQLFPLLPASSLGRITGAQPVEERRRDQHKPLILATPTVDIGYNFIKHDKRRQNLDFVIFDARFEDEFFQRLGRAGRVLGKVEQNTPAHAVALLADEVVARFARLDGQTLTRQAFAAFIRTNGVIGAKDDFSTYLRAGGMLENAAPILNAQRMFAQTEAGIMEKAFDTVKQVFAPQSNWTYQNIGGCWRKQQTLTRWLREPQAVKPAELNRIMAEFLGWSLNQDIPAAEIAGHEASLLREQQVAAGFRTWCEMQAALIQSHFQFRDSFSGPAAAVYDPEHLLSSANVTEYDLLHIVENYEFEPWTPEVFAAKAGEPPAPDALGVWLRSRRQERQRVRLQWRPPVMKREEWNVVEFERCFAAGNPAALKGVTLQADTPLPHTFRTTLEKQHVTALLVPASLQGHLLRAIQPRGIYTRDLLVQLPDRDIKYSALLGTSALLIAPLLRWAFGLQQRQQDTAIIC